MSQQINKKLSHLTGEQITQLVSEYLLGMKVDELLAKYQINVKSSELVKILPPHPANIDCPYCEIVMYAPVKARSSSYAPSAFCCCCYHTDRNGCTCKSCVEKQKAIFDKKNESFIIAIKDHYQIHTRKPFLLPHELSLKEAVFLISLFFLSNSGDACSIAPLDECSDILSPLAELDSTIIETLMQSNLIAVDPMSPIQAFVFQDGIPGAYYPRKVFYVPIIGENPEQAASYISELVEIIKRGSWPLNWYKDAENLWRLISLHECMEIYTYYANEYHLSAPISDKTKIIFSELIQELSLGSIQNAIYYSVRDSVAYMVQKDLHPHHAANLVMHTCQRYVARAKDKGWELKPFKRNFNLPRSVVSHIFHNAFLKHLEESDNLICHAITPEYIGGSVLEISTEASNFGGNIHLTKDNCTNFNISLNLGSDIDLGNSKVNICDADEIAFKIAKKKYTAFNWKLTAYIPDINDKIISVAPVVVGELPIFNDVTVAQDLLESALSQQVFEAHMQFVTRIIDTAKNRMKEL